MEDFEDFLVKNLPKVDSFHPNYQNALEMMLKAKGKRFRPQLLLSVVNAYEPLLIKSAMRVALAIEMFHTYSLIHDDLPAMDNSSLRRGYPTIHTKYDEATAILIGDALNTDSFYLIATSAFRDDIKIKLIKILSESGGSSGMVLGQALDLYFEKTSLDLDSVITLHINKTAKIIAGSLKMGGVIVNLDKNSLDNLYNFGITLGLLFQIQDDILDATQTQEEAGKPTNIDGDKNSFVNLLGLNESIKYADSLVSKIEKELNKFDKNLRDSLLKLIQKYLKRHKKNK